MRSFEYRAAARELLRGRWGAVMRVMLLARIALAYFFVDVFYQVFFTEPVFAFELGDTGMSYVLLGPKGAGYALLALILALGLFSGVTVVGCFRLMLGLRRGEPARAAQLFPMRQAGRIICMNLLRDLLVGLQMLLFVVPGIVAAYSYSMADFLMAENPELGAAQALRESRRRMHGRRMELFSLQLSFLGWLLLTAMALLVVENLLLSGSVLGALYNPWLLALLELASGMLTALMELPAMTYILAAEALFFAGCAGGARDAEEADAPQAAEPEPEPQAPPVDEAQARALYRRFGCSRARMREAGLAEQYEAMGASPISEERWRREYAGELMLRFDREPEALNEILNLVAEYGMEELADRALERVERHIRQSSLPPEEILGMCGRMLATLAYSGAFSQSEGFVARKRAQVLDMAARLERRLMDENPDGSWRGDLEKIRGM